jgi:uncharacterized protein (DUF427 family)
MPHPTELIEAAVSVEPSPRWVRATFNGVTIVDSKRVMLLHERGRVPVYYFPKEDVRFEHLEGTDHATHCPHKGDAAYWSIRVGDRVAENAVWGYPEPKAGQEVLADLVAFYWNELDHWYEEDDEVYVHPRDPYRRVDAMHSSRHVQVMLGGEVVADTRRPVLLYETGLPTRYYVPPQDVRLDLLRRSPTVTRCPYKGVATTWTAEVNGTTYEDIAWSYPYPIPELPKIENLICFYDENVDEVIVDGEVEEKPQTRWSR